MNILICISHVPDTTTRIKFTEDNSELDKEGVTFVINPYDEFALSRSLELRENKVIEGEIHILCVGPKEVEPTIRKALAVGGEKGIRIDAEANDAMEVAQQITDYVKSNPNYDMIMMGKESIDNNGSQVPGMVAAMLDVPFISFATSLEIEDGKAVLTREIDGGQETIETTTPFVLSSQKGLAEWRIPNMRGIMMAKRKPLETVEAQETTAFTQIDQYELPPPKGDVQYIEPENVEEVVKLLEEKGVF